MTKFWHPQAQMSTVQHHEIVIERGEGCYLWTEDGTRLLDATAALWYANVGHGRAEIADAVAAQMRTLETYQTFDRYATRPALDLSERIVALSPFDDSAKVILSSGGSDAIEVAAKLARRYFHAIDKPEKRIILSRENAHHGLHGFGTSLGWLEANREGYGSLDADIVRTSATDWELVEKSILDAGPELVAAFFCEPVIGTGGVIFPGEEYLARVRELCRIHGILFVADEVITGFGRTGHWFASQRFDLDPDMVAFAKGVTSGYLPLGGLIVSGAVAEPFWRDGSDTSFRHGVTYSSHASACVAALANLDILESEDLIARVRELETVVETAMRPLADLDAVEEVRAGTGLLAAVDLRDAQLAARVERYALAHGVLLRKIARGNTLQISPPFVVTDDEVRLIADTIRAGLEQ